MMDVRTGKEITGSTAFAGVEAAKSAVLVGAKEYARQERLKSLPGYLFSQRTRTLSVAEAEAQEREMALGAEAAKNYEHYLRALKAELNLYEREAAEFGGRPQPLTEQQYLSSMQEFERLESQRRQLSEKVGASKWAEMIVGKRREESEFKALVAAYPGGRVWKEVRPPGMYKMGSGEKYEPGALGLFEITKKPTKVTKIKTAEQIELEKWTGKSSLEKYAAGGYGPQSLEDALGTFLTGATEETYTKSIGYSKAGFKSLESIYTGLTGKGVKQSGTYVEAKRLAGKAGAGAVSAIPSIPLMGFGLYQAVKHPFETSAMAVPLVTSVGKEVSEDPLGFGASTAGAAVTFGGLGLIGKGAISKVSAKWYASSSRAAWTSKVSKLPGRELSLLSSKANQLLIEPAESFIGSSRAARFASGKISPLLSEAKYVTHEVKTGALTAKYEALMFKESTGAELKSAWVQSGLKSAWSEYPPISAYRGLKQFFAPPEGTNLIAEDMVLKPSLGERVGGLWERVKPGPTSRYKWRQEELFQKWGKPYVETSSKILATEEPFYWPRESAVKQSQLLDLNLQIKELKSFEPWTQPKGLGGYANIEPLDLSILGKRTVSQEQFLTKFLDVKDFGSMEDFFVSGAKPSSRVSTSTVLGEFFNVPTKPRVSSFSWTGPTSDLIKVGSLEEIQVPTGLSSRIGGGAITFLEEGGKISRGKLVKALSSGEVFSVEGVSPLVVSKPSITSSVSRLLASERGSVSYEQALRIISKKTSEPWSVGENQFNLYLRTKPRSLLTPDEYEYLYGAGTASLLTLGPGMREGELAKFPGSKVPSGLSFESSISADLFAPGALQKSKRPEELVFSAKIGAVSPLVKPGLGEVSVTRGGVESALFSRTGRRKEPSVQLAPRSVFKSFFGTAELPSYEVLTAQGRGNLLGSLQLQRVKSLTRTELLQRSRTRQVLKLEEPEPPEEVKRPSPTKLLGLQAPERGARGSRNPLTFNPGKPRRVKYKVAPISLLDVFAAESLTGREARIPVGPLTTARYAREMRLGAGLFDPYGRIRPSFRKLNILSKKVSIHDFV
jgi:hypothetical protein